MKKLSRMQYALFTLLLSFTVTISTSAQIVIGQDTLVGNEWIDYDQSYFKMMLAEDGLYRVSYNELAAAGVPVESITGAELQVFYFGEEQSIRVSTDGPLSSSDYIEFIGVKNRGELDKHLYREEAHQLNPLYSLYTDTSAYYLTWEQGSQGNRFVEETVDLTGNTINPEPYYMHQDVVVFSNRVNKPSEQQDVRFSQYMPGEGFCGDLNAINTYNHSVNNKFENGPNPQIDIRLSGNNVSHRIDISVNNDLKLTSDFGRNETKQYNLQLQSDDIENGTATVEVKSYLGTADRNTIANSILSYPREFDFENKSEYQFNLSASTQSRLIEIENFDLSNQEIYIIDKTNNIRYTPVIEDDKVKVLMPSSEETITLIIVSAEAIKSVTSVEESVMVDYSQMTNVDFIMYTAKQFDKASGDGVNYLRAYAEHRASNNGGDFTPAIVFIEDLVNQFCYGINRHPLSMKNHARWVSENWIEAQYNFIIGKSIEYSFTRTEEQLSDTDKLQLILPTFGVPGSDNSLLAKKNHSRPRLATGRISANSVDDIKSYYNKVTTRENPLNYPSSIDGRLWTKKVVHLSGGGSPENVTIASQLEGMGNILKQNRFGGDVVTFSKESSDNIQTGFSTRIKNEMRDGVGLLAFFGHSAPGALDFSLEKANQYENEGKLPIFFSMGCYSGNVHTFSRSISEDFVLEPSVGSIVYLAASGSAFLNTQGDLGRQFYETIGTEEYYNASIGKIMHLLLEEHDLSTDFTLLTLNQQFTLHGDPAIKLVTFNEPDYTIDYSSVNTKPSIITPESENFEVEFDIVNLGENVNDSIDVRAIQFLPDGSAIDTVYTKISAPSYSTNQTITLKNPGLVGIGENCFSIELNYDESVVESPAPDAYTNNTLGVPEGEGNYCYYVLDNSANPIYPENFAIVNSDELKLVASTSNILAEDKTYILELDTTALFNSVLKKTETINEAGGSLTWEPEIELTPGEVYYWRVSADSTDVNIGYLWRQSSFIYLPNSSEGWNQSHYYQFLENNLEGIDYENRQLDFINEGISISGNIQIPESDSEGNEVVWPRWYENDFPVGQMRTWDYPGAGIPDGIAIAYRDNDINVFVRNQSTGGGMGQYGSVYRASTRRVFFFPTNDPQSRIDAVNMLTDPDIIPDGYHVFVYTVTNSPNSDLNIDEWGLDSLNNDGKNIFNVLEAQGASLVRKLEERGTVPYGVMYTKNEFFRDEGIGTDKFSVVSITSEFERNYTEGDFNTPNIGPALSWDKLIWNTENETENDTFMVYVKGMNVNGNMDTLLTVIAENEVDLSNINAEIYPYLRLDMFIKDEINRTPINVDFWRVLYNAAPEAILTKDESFVFNSDILQQGEKLEFSIKAENVSTTDMDSLLVKYSITNENNVTITSYDRLAPLKANEVLELNFDYDTRTLSGNNQFNFEINPDSDQPERFFFNNFGVRDFFVKEDEKEPVLDVSFDGVHIINGDLVSSNPFILIDVKDENEFLLLDDPEKFTVSIIDPNGNETDYTVASPELTFEAASDLNNNQAKISLEPLLTQDGDYILKVQAADATGNINGETDYQVTFRVILKESVSNVLNYPNPFSSQTQFIFTLTGSEVPDDISISILTVSGKVVKEISREELGPLRIGLNRTDYKWNGTDDYGEKLGNGVYLYKVNLPADMERYANESADRFFTKGFGKLVIMR